MKGEKLDRVRQGQSKKNLISFRVDQHEVFDKSFPPRDVGELLVIIIMMKVVIHVLIFDLHCSSHLI